MAKRGRPRKSLSGSPLPPDCKYFEQQIPNDSAIFEAAALRYQYRPRRCSRCEAADAAAHPLAIGAVVTVLEFRNGCFVAEGIATILRPAAERDVYLIRFRGETRIEERLIFPDYQHDVARALHVVTQHLASTSRPASTPPQPPTPGERL